MAVTNKEYEKMANNASPPSPKIKNVIKAFCIGGLICVIGEIMFKIFEYFGLSEKNTAVLVPIILIALTAILTAFGIFDKIARHAGAGTIVPITGFANSIVSPAMEYQVEGRVLGTAANMFKIAGPVIVYSSVTAVIYGFIYWIISK